MNFDTAVTIMFAAITVLAYVGYRYFSDNVKLTYKDQRVGGARHG